MTRLVVHAGFHKTGTTSVQSLMEENRTLLEEEMRCYLRPDFLELTEAARAFSEAPEALRLAEVTQAAEAFFATLDPTDPRPILMSSEDLSGHMPGRFGIEQYDAAPLVLAQLELAAREHLGAQTDVIYFFSTREAESWLRSNWWQNLRTTRLTQGFEEYAGQFSMAADLPVMVSAIAEIVAPARVVSTALEDSKDTALGPLSPLLDLIGASTQLRERLVELPPANVQPDLGLEEVFLALNRSGLKPKPLARAKKALMQIAHTDKMRKERAAGEDT